MKKKFTITIVFTVPILLILAVLLINFFTTHITTKKYNQEHKLILIDGDEKTTVLFTGIGVTTPDGLKYVIKNNPSLAIDKDKVKEFTTSLNDNRRERVYPRITVVDDEYQITEYDNGNEINDSALYRDILDNCNKLTYEVDLNDYLYTLEDGKSPEDEYNRLQDLLTKIKNFNITYSNSKSITYDDIKPYLNYEDEKFIISVENDELKEYVDDFVDSCAGDYETYKNEWDFTTTSGENIKIKTDPKMYGEGVYGNKVDHKKEQEYILNAIADIKSEDNRTPILSQSGQDKIPDTYIEVSIKDQHVWVYEDGEMMMESGCVTGRKNSMDTPKGVFYIFQKAHNVNFPTGGSSKNWMKFTSHGHGLHDAKWRSNSQFGNTSVYLSNGSHGCVNLPIDFSTTLYDTVDEGTVVVIY